MADTYSCLIVSVVALFCHELGHVAAAWVLGISWQQISFLPFGGKIQLEGDFLWGKGEFCLAFAGPLVNLLLAAIFFSVPTTALGLWFAEANLLIGICNLVPVLPLDGGRMSRSVLLFLGYYRVSKSLTLLGVCLSVVLFCGSCYLFVLGQGNYWFAVMSLSLWYICWQEYRDIFYALIKFILYAQSNCKKWKRQRLYASENQKLLQILSKLAPGRKYCFSVRGRNLSEEYVLELALNHNLKHRLGDFL